MSGYRYSIAKSDYLNTSKEDCNPDILVTRLHLICMYASKKEKCPSEIFLHHEKFKILQLLKLNIHHTDHPREKLVNQQSIFLFKTKGFNTIVVHLKL